jgi:hypothetical protein
MTMMTAQPSDGPIDTAASSEDPRRAPILARTIFRELRANGLCEREIMTVASELLAQLAADLRADS